MRRRRPIQSEITTAEAYGTLRADFDVNNSSRYMPQLRGVSSMGSGADYHYRNEVTYLRGIERARSFDRNNMVVGQAVTRLVDNVLQDGFTLDPQTGEPDLDSRLRKLWLDWSSDPDACDDSGEHTFPRMAKLILRQVIVDGDVIVLPLDRDTLEVVEAHRVRKSMGTRRNVIHGVLLNDRRQHVEYWLAKHDVSPLSPSPRLKDMKRYPTRDPKTGKRQVFHIYNPKRFSQTRGVTAFAPIVFPAGMHDDLQFTQLIKAQVAACYSVFRERELGFEGSLGGTQRGEQSTDILSDGSTRTLEGIAPGMEVIGEPGEKLTGFSPNIPNPEFFQHATMILSIIAVNLGMPVQLLLLDATKTNFSGWRGAMDQARIGFRDLQKWLLTTLHRPVYIWKVEQWLAMSAELRELAAGKDVDVLSHRWNPPSWPYIEPLKDRQANKVALETNQTSPRRQRSCEGEDWEEIAEEIPLDRGLLIRNAIREAEAINQEFTSASVDWREVAGFDLKGKPQPAAQERKPVGVSSND